MAYSAQVVSKARQLLEQKIADKKSRYRQDQELAYTKVPRIREIDILLRQTMAAAALTVFEEGGDIRAAMEKVKEENLRLQQERKDLIEKNFAPGFLDETPVCPVCGGSGYVGSSMCRCLELLCSQEQRKELRQLTCGYETFSSFRLDYYPEQVDRTYGASPRAIMEHTFRYCKQYAENFQPGVGNLMFVGGTGLGKTFLSACIANAVTDKGYSVAYESAPQLFSKLEKNRFNPTEETREAAERFENCDLLIIDDLGTEMSGNFVTAALYSLINGRLLAGKSMVISTNLNADEIAVRYSPQIASRLVGEFKGLTFVGKDIRLLKNRGL